MTQGEAAQRLSVPKGTIANWVAAAKHGRGPVSGAKTAQELESEIARLRKELAEVKQEREVLKKAAAYFAKESQQGGASLRQVFGVVVNLPNLIVIGMGQLHFDPFIVPTELVELCRCRRPKAMPAHFRAAVPNRSQCSSDAIF